MDRMELRMRCLEMMHRERLASNAAMSPSQMVETAAKLEKYVLHGVLEANDPVNPTDQESAEHGDQ